ncbi:MAG TPA: hypothetical protein VF897_16975, partial [Roseiflexaceae bacterium]
SDRQDVLTHAAGRGLVGAVASPAAAGGLNGSRLGAPADQVALVASVDLEVERAQQPVVGTKRALCGGSFRDGRARRIELLIAPRRDATCNQRLGPGDPALSPRGAELLDLH